MNRSSNFHAWKLFMILPAMLSLMPAPVWAQAEPYRVQDTRPLILTGPYLVAPSDEGISVVWLTDTPCHSRVLWGTREQGLTNVVESQEHGLVEIGTRHAVRLTGLTPGVTYQDQAGYLEADASELRFTVRDISRRLLDTLVLSSKASR